MLHALPHPQFWILHIDGSAEPNPGRMSIGVVISGAEGQVELLSNLLPSRGCNNEAELGALQAGLELALRQGAGCIRVYTDSRWLLEQLDPDSVRARRVRPTVRLAEGLEKVRTTLQAFEDVQWRWIPQHHNTQADALARQALGFVLEK